MRKKVIFIVPVLLCLLAGFFAVTISMRSAAKAAAPVQAAPQVASTYTLTLKLADPNGLGNSVVVTHSDGSSIGTCQIPGGMVNTICKITVSANSGVVLSAQPATGEALMSYQDSNCQYAPGPVCHVQVHTANKTVIATFGTAPAGPVVTTSSPVAMSHSYVCSFGDNTVTVNGTGFTPNTNALLYDDGNQVATGVTDGSGSVQLNFGAQSHPGVYRILTIAVGGQSASTDVYNGLVYCYTYGTPTNQISIGVFENDLDARHIENYTTFASNPAVPVAFANASDSKAGIGQTGAQTYACPTGTSQALILYGARGVGTKDIYSDTIVVTIPCGTSSLQSAVSRHIVSVN